MGRPGADTVTPWYQRLLRAEARGECVRCGDELDRDGCATCRADQRDAQDGRRERYVSQGLCRCGAAPVEPGRLHCAGCLAWDRDRVSLRSADRRAAGLCAQCGRVQSETYRCPSCSPVGRARATEQGLMDRPK